MIAAVPADVISRLKAVLARAAGATIPSVSPPSWSNGATVGAGPRRCWPCAHHRAGGGRGGCLRRQQRRHHPPRRNTGLVGGQIPQGEILLSLEKMRAVRDLDPFDDVIVVEAGVTLAAVHEAALAADRVFPLSLASEGSATVGGLISTNAGGTAVLRYGTMRGLVLGIEAVLPKWRDLERP